MNAPDRDSVLRLAITDAIDAAWTDNAQNITLTVPGGALTHRSVDGGRVMSRAGFTLAIMALLDRLGLQPDTPPAGCARKQFNSTPALDYEAAKDFFYAKLGNDRHGRGRMESAYFHTAMWIFEQGCAGREALLARIAELEAHGEPIGYFCDVNMLTPEQGKRIEQVCESAKDDCDVFPLYTAAHVAREGWQLVPVEPTPEMRAVKRFYGDASASTIYRAMLAAAPEHPHA